MNENCLILIKPDGISRGLVPTIRNRILAAGLTILQEKYITATEDQCRKHYQVKMRNYGASEDQTVKYLSRSYVKEGSVLVMLVSGKQAIAKALKIKTDMRKNFALDTLEKCTAEGRSLYNILHSSENEDDAKKEAIIWLS